MKIIQKLFKKNYKVNFRKITLLKYIKILNNHNILFLYSHLDKNLENKEDGYQNSIFDAPFVASGDIEKAIEQNYNLDENNLVQSETEECKDEIKENELQADENEKHEVKDMNTERKHKIKENCFQHEPKTEEEIIISQMINPLLAPDIIENTDFHGIHLKTVSSKYLRIIINILNSLDKNEDITSLDIFSASPTENLSLPELYCLLCNAEYLGLPNEVLFNIIKRWISHESFIKFDLIKEYFMSSIPESLSPLPLFFPSNFLIFWSLLGWIDEEGTLLSKENNWDLVRWLYLDYSQARVADREKRREKAHFLFDDQLFYLPVKYHLIHEEEEETSLSQLEVVREAATALLSFLQPHLQKLSSIIPSSVFGYYHNDQADFASCRYFIDFEKNGSPNEIDEMIRIESSKNNLHLLESTDDEDKVKEEIKSNLEWEAKLKIDRIERERAINEKLDAEILHKIKEIQQKEAEEKKDENEITDQENLIVEIEPPLSLLETISCGFLYEPVKHLFHFDPLRKIKVLNLRGCVSMSKYVVHYILEACTEIKDLNLSFLQWIDDETIKLVANRFKNTLTILQLRYCNKITNQGITYLWEDISGYSRVFKEKTESGEDTK